MSREAFQAAIARMDEEQLAALQACIMAERRLRNLYPRDAAAGSALEEAYQWALEAPVGPMARELRATSTAASPSQGASE